MANGTAEIFTPDGDADEERGIELAELYANFHTVDGELRTADEADTVQIPEQPQPWHDMEVTSKETDPLGSADNNLPPTVEGGKALYGTFSGRIEFAGGLAIEGMTRGRDIARLNRLQADRLGRYVVPRVIPGGW